ncbi:hypothetical protein CHN50_14360 [Priestia aryabhattai]|uniref:hypothetical protein n=1 Tax=Bacillaceae TaxID=186817 RepID=UPI000BA03AAD|nr:hypothetical protein [Bacillus sp. CBEL-1]OZT12071.1 hypothetical protein CHN50_14360 [Priestia aryabhattai]TDB50077.1 3-isopropylmalate dehydratase [Bacillus sp. CBEL-1]
MPISSIMYSYVVRKVDRFQQHYIKKEYELQLCTNQVKCNARSFTLEQVLDISYKPFSSEKGLLYLHTHQGVFKYEIQADPSAFINEYKRLKTT